MNGMNEERNITNSKEVPFIFNLFNPILIKIIERYFHFPHFNCRANLLRTSTPGGKSLIHICLEFLLKLMT